MADTLTTNIKLTNQEEGTNLNTWGVLADATSSASTTSLATSLGSIHSEATLC